MTYEQRQKLKVYIRELENRGIPVADLLRKRFLAKARKWITDSNGYFTRRDGKLFKPYEQQKLFVASKSRFSLFIGGRGSGKSCGGAQKAILKLKQGQSGAVLNPKFENFKDSTWPEFRDWIPWDYVVPAHRYRSEVSWEPTRPFKIVFENGAFVNCKGLHDPASARGPNLNWLWFDEAQEDDTGDAWNVATSSVRIGENPQAWATATGRGTYHWMYEFFVEQKFPEEVWKELEKIIGGLPADTPFIDWYEGSIYDNSENVDPAFMAAILANYPSGFKHAQEVLGKFADPGGNRGDARWFKDRVLNDIPPSVKNRVRYWDLAATEKKITGKKKINDPDETVGTKLSWWIDENVPDKYSHQYCIEHQVAGTWEWADIKAQIIQCAKEDGPFIPIYLEEEPGSGGINQVAQIKLDVAKELPGWTVRGHKPEGDKIVRADIWFAEACENENHPVRQFWMVKGEWNEDFLKQLSSFPNARHDDKVDSVSGARVCCAPIRKWSRQKFVYLGTKFEEKKNEIEVV